MELRTDIIDVEANLAYRPAALFEGRYLVLYGGAGSGKSRFAAQKNIGRCLVNEEERILVVRKVARTLRESTFVELREALHQFGPLGQGVKFNKSTLDIQFPNGAEIIHAGLDDVEKLKSISGVTSIWFEEATEGVETDLVQLDLRMRGACPTYFQIILTFNPVNVRSYLKRRFVDETFPDSMVLHTTYKDNRFVGDEYRAVLEGIQDETYRDVYLLGKWGQVRRGLIYPDWFTAPAIPEGETVYGLDFGFNVATALVEVTEHDGDLYARQHLYETHLTNADLIERLKATVPDKRTAIYCDAAEPQRIEEIRRAGFNAKPADKDVLKGIDSIKARTLNVHEKSKDLVTELRDYRWTEAKDGEILDKPRKQADHAMDALRYAVHTRWGLPRHSKLLG